MCGRTDVWDIILAVPHRDTVAPSKNPSGGIKGPRVSIGSFVLPVFFSGATLDMFVNLDGSMVPAISKPKTHHVKCTLGSLRITCTFLVTHMHLGIHMLVPIAS
ncbi:uncharacterized protein EV420DRAFT_673814 [Desarmillaria tabescens]|uniref:Uncharacterized protein n=1 Tax=Armillaria tabescens TaxID=1929756 RepID=A0AA39NKE5_ARMTA|nr:uncharacterized protein EV420DRAFT_673814 [Desarmillaria tabescens]KAK0467245.1 hypothetical protein EV420DRAFT_673814 [Desarmillaria tabescens]